MPDTEQSQKTLNIVEVIKDVRRGNAAYEATLALEQVLVNVRKTGKAASMTMKLTVAPVRPGSAPEGRESMQVWIDMETTGKLAKPDTQPDLQFLSAALQLSKRNPDQAEFRGEGFSAGE